MSAPILVRFFFAFLQTFFHAVHHIANILLLSISENIYHSGLFLI